MFFNFDIIERQEFKQYNDVIFVDLNLQNILFMMHISSSRITVVSFIIQVCLVVGIWGPILRETEEKDL